MAESTGKQGTGILPIADEPLADAGAYGPDRVFVHLRDADAPDPRHAEAMHALAAAGHPTITLTAAGVADLGRLFFFAEFATAVAGWALGINPFDQPNVQEAKDNTAKVLEQGAPEGLQDGSLAELLDGLAAPGYLAIMGYLPYDDAIDRAIARLRAAVIARHGVATTWGYGPRFLHSTGQFHKGGPPTGRFLQLVHDSDADLDVPGKPYSFRTLIDAQADGDLQTLRDHGLPGRPRAAARRRPGRRHHPTPGAAPVKLGFVGLGKMGGNMVHRIHRDSDHQVVAFDFSAGGRRGRRGPRRERRLLARGPRLQARRAAPGLADGAGGRPDREDGRRARRAARGGRHDRRRRQQQLARRRAPRLRARRITGSTTSTSARPAASGGWRSATA